MNRQKIFGGRVQELSIINELFNKALRNEGQLLILRGEPGIGKTAIADQFLHSIETNKVKVFTGQCAYFSQEIEPFLPFRQIFAEITTKQGKSGRLSKNEYMATAVRLAPAWISTIPIIGSLAAAVFETGKEVRDLVSASKIENVPQSMLIQFINLIVHLTKASPLVLVIEDFHWADSSTVYLLKLLTEKAINLPLFLLVLMRPAYSTPNAERLETLNEFMVNIHYLQNARLIELYGLDESSITEIMRIRGLGVKIPDSLPKLLRKQTGGNPLFLLELLNLWEQLGWLVKRKNSWQLNQDIHLLPIPETIQDVFKLRLNQLTQGQRNLLDVASVEGYDFILTTIVKAVNALFKSPHGDIYNDVRYIEDVYALIKEVVDSEQSRSAVSAVYRFVHGVLHQMLYDSLIPEQRRDYHHVIGNSLEDLYNDQAEVIANTLAFHFHRGYIPDKAIHYYQIAAETALEKMFSFQEARNLYQGMLDVLKENNLINWDVTGDAYSGIAHAMRNLGQLEQAISYYHKAIEAYTMSGRKGKTCPLFQMIGVCYRGLDKPEESLAWYQKALELAIISKDKRMEGNILRDKGYILIKVGRLDEAKEHFFKALELLSEIGEKANGGMCWQGLAYIHYLKGQFTQAVECLKTALGMVQSTGHAYYEVTVLYYLGAYHVDNGFFKEAKGYIDKGLNLAEEHGFEFELVQLKRVQGRLAIASTDYVNGYITYADCFIHAYHCNPTIVRKVKEEVLSQMDRLFKSGHANMVTQFCNYLIYAGKTRGFERIDSKYIILWQSVQKYMAQPVSDISLQDYGMQLISQSL